MEPIITTAIIGTGQVADTKVSTGTPVDTLATQLPDSDPERKFLLTAGAWAVYRKAGKVPEQIPEAHEPAPAEMLAPCTERAASLFDSLFSGGHVDLLPEALVRMREAQLRLPYQLLPQALDHGAKSIAIRSLLFPVLGERGRWISHLNNDWSWATQYLPLTKAALPPDAETIWEEGVLGQRVEILQRFRMVDAAQARERLARIWQKEYANGRAKLIEAMQTGLSAEDEPFLEQALNDRAESVRSKLASLLVRIPGSGLLERMLQRANGILNLRENRFIVTLPPPNLPADWQRDGVQNEDQGKAGKRESYMIQVLSLIPPTYWTERFGITAEALLAIAKDSGWQEQLIEGWTNAVLLHGGTDWVLPLWSWWCTFLSNNTTERYISGSQSINLGSLAPQAEAEALVSNLQAGSKLWYIALTTLPKPWSTPFATAYLQGLRRFVKELTTDTYQQDSEWSPQTNFWFQSLRYAARALPYPCFFIALQQWSLPEQVENSGNNKLHYRVQTWRDELRNIIAMIETRKSIIEEII